MLSLAERNRRALELEPDVRFIAARLWRTLPRSVELDDLISAGWVGLLSAAPRWTPGRASFSSFCLRRASGAMLDYLRDLDHLSRSERKKAKADERPTLTVVAVEGLHERYQLVDSEWKSQQLAHDYSIDVTTLMDKAGIGSRYRFAVTCRLRGENMKAIGKQLGVNESRASQMVAESVAKMRGAMETNSPCRP